MVIHLVSHVVAAQGIKGHTDRVISFLQTLIVCKEHPVSGRCTVKVFCLVEIEYNNTSNERAIILQHGKIQRGEYVCYVMLSSMHFHHGKLI